MIYRMKIVEGPPEEVDVGLDLFREVVSECCRAVDGFRGGYFLVDRDTGTTATLTLWADAAALDEGRRNLAERLAGDAEAREAVEHIHASGRVTFPTFEVAHTVAPEGGAAAGLP